jgi:hypothetical protein
MHEMDHLRKLNLAREPAWKPWQNVLSSLRHYQFAAIKEQKDDEKRGFSSQASAFPLLAPCCILEIRNAEREFNDEEIGKQEMPTQSMPEKRS